MLKVINGFEIKTAERRKTTTIKFFMNGDLFTQTTLYDDISSEKIEKIRDQMMEFMKININATKQVETVPLVTMLQIINNISE